jgi:hypothetical protein
LRAHTQGRWRLFNFWHNVRIYWHGVSLSRGRCHISQCDTLVTRIQEMGFRESVAHVSFNVIAVQQVQPATQQGALALTNRCRNQDQRTLPVFFELV